MVRFLISFSLIFLFSCSSLSKNFVKQGEYVFSGGVYQSERWNETLDLSRTSWFQELTLIFEVLQTSITEASPFARWFSDYERKYLSSCHDFKIALVYHWESVRISENMFFEQMAAYGYQKVSLPEFSHQIRMHPSYEKLALQQYRLYGLCQNNNHLSPKLAITFPGFKEVTLN